MTIRDRDGQPIYLVDQDNEVSELPAQTSKKKKKKEEEEKADGQPAPDPATGE